MSLLKKLPRPSLTQILVSGLILLQFPLWFGDGGWIRVWRLERALDQKTDLMAGQRQRILELEAEARDLKSSSRAAEERARYELGLILPGEQFVQWVQPTERSEGAQSRGQPAP